MNDLYCPYCEQRRKEVLDLLFDRAELVKENLQLHKRYEHLIVEDETVRAQPSRLTGLH